jgi:protoporphyrinogen oxidase
MAKKKIIILGAGLAGLSAAWHLQRKGLDCRVFEKEPEVGGLCRSKKIGGFVFDYDGHLLHFRHHYTFELVKGLLNGDLIEHKRNSWIYSSGTYTRYPFQANLYGLPAHVIKECLMGFIEISKNGHPRKHANFLDWINLTFGKGIASHFMIPYNTKFWTLPPQRLTCEWLDGFIPVPSLNQVLEGTLEESQRLFGYNARFWYPETGGINQLAIAFSSGIKNIHTSLTVTGIDLVNKQIKLSSGDKEQYDLLISTIPLPELPAIIKNIPSLLKSSFKKLNWNSIFNLNLGIDKVNCLNRHWVYFPEESTSFFRVGFPHNFSSSLTLLNKNSLYAEVAYSKDKPIDKHNIAKRIIEDLKKLSIINREQDILVQYANDITYGYPVYDKYYAQTRQAILEFLNHNHIIPCGRYGSWRYMSMEDVILEGRDVAKKAFDNV